jgi:hypothetical protein
MSFNGAADGNAALGKSRRGPTIRALGRAAVSRRPLGGLGISLGALRGATLVGCGCAARFRRGDTGSRARPAAATLSAVASAPAASDPGAAVPGPMWSTMEDRHYDEHATRTHAGRPPEEGYERHP